MDRAAEMAAENKGSDGVLEAAGGCEELNVLRYRQGLNGCLWGCGCGKDSGDGRPSPDVRSHESSIRRR